NALDGRGQAAQRLQLRAVRGELRPGGQVAVDEQVGDLLEGAAFGDVEDVVAAIVKIVATPTDGAERRVAGRHTGERDGFLRGGLVHRSLHRGSAGRRAVLRQEDSRRTGRREKV